MANVSDAAPQILVDINLPEWSTDVAYVERLREFLPQTPILAWDSESRDTAELANVRMIACINLRPGLALHTPRLALVHKLGAGVQGIVCDPSLPAGVRVARVHSGTQAQEIVEYCLAYTLRFQRNMEELEAAQRERAWRSIPPRETSTTTVGVLGLGQIGARVVQVFSSFGFNVLGWARSPRAICGVECLTGESGLAKLLSEADIIASILPSTPATRDLMNASRFALMKPGSLFINVGRGDLVVEEALLAALDAGRPGRAVLDVTRVEPLPSSSPLWEHPAVTITPHNSGWRTTGAVETVAENWRRLVAGETLLHEVDREQGY